MAKFRQKHPWIYYLAGLLWVLLLVYLDQKLKCLVEARFKAGGSQTLISGVLSLGYVENRGMAFGLFQGGRLFFIILTLPILGILGLVYHAIPEEKRFWPLSLGTLFIAAGALGNLIDRMRLGYVIDYLQLDFMEFPLFNLADCYLTWTVVLLAVLLLFFYKNEDLKRIHL